MTALGGMNGGHLRAIAAALATVVTVGAVAFLLGGGSYLASAAIWGGLALAALALLVIGLARRRPLRLLVALPIVIGGASAVAAGAWDYVPWLTSPLVWLGALGSAATGVWLVRSGRASPGDTAVGFTLGLIVFGLGLVVLYVAVIVFAILLHPLGGAPPP
jgi:hypothetical protein